MNGRGYPKASLSQKRAAAALQMLLCGCTKERLRTFTADSLASSYNVTHTTAEKMLSAARKGRGL
jgi:hypothetical protein